LLKTMREIADLIVLFLSLFILLNYNTQKKKTQKMQKSKKQNAKSKTHIIYKIEMIYRYTYICILTLA
jgi:hypothetical protein